LLFRRDEELSTVGVSPPYRDSSVPTARAS
jgi:hypothetical protein